MITIELEHTHSAGTAGALPRPRATYRRRL
jgi:hypothetical protein